MGGTPARKSASKTTIPMLGVHARPEGLIAVKDLVTAVASSAHYAQAIRMENAFLPSLRRILPQKPQRLVPAVRNIVAHRRTGMIRIAGLALSDFL
jgi:hypothetical protein